MVSDNGENETEVFGVLTRYVEQNDDLANVGLQHAIRRENSI